MRLKSIKSHTDGSGFHPNQRRSTVAVDPLAPLAASVGASNILVCSYHHYGGVFLTKAQNTRPVEFNTNYLSPLELGHLRKIGRYRFMQWSRVHSEWIDRQQFVFYLGGPAIQAAGQFTASQHLV
jgi:hypothetical protein